MKTECPHCGQHYEVDNEYLDQIVQCASCDQEFVVEVMSGGENSHKSQNQTNNETETARPAPVVEEKVVVTDSTSSSGLKALACEMCGSTELIKQNGVFVCQSCGTKYSLEDAKQMMIRGTVQVAGTVTVDNSSAVRKYLYNARRALEKTDWEEVEKYYNLVEQNEPENIEAIFYSSYGRAMLSLTDGDRFKRQQKFDVFCKSISVIDDHYDVKKTAEYEPILKGMSAALIEMTCTSFVYNKREDEIFSSGDSKYTEIMFANAELQFIESLENIAENDPKEYLLKILTIHYTRCIANSQISGDTASFLRHRMCKTVEMIKKTDPEFSATPPARGCYIATSVYGSYDCPEVWTLRRFRDDCLGKDFYGRVFVRIYYLFSPTLVKYLGCTKIFKLLWKHQLDKLVSHLQRQGIESTPYKDKDW